MPVINIENLLNFRSAGVALIGSMCSDRSIAIVDIAQNNSLNPNALAKVIAREVEHALGLDHIEGEI
ncbi:hypothetical protein HZS_4283 [Henneguya salminicola]|nr:hypothetical protein HZS_4283 [Henneguya salminicola]